MTIWERSADIPEPPEPDIFATCHQCCGEIYDGESYYEIDGKYIHIECLSDFAAEYFADCKKEAVVRNAKVPL